jgi:hypothetical protein
VYRPASLWPLFLGPPATLICGFRAWLAARPQATASSAPYPVFFIAAESGGIHAAYWTATVLAAIEKRYLGFTQRVYLISCISGGSVGAAVFDAMYGDFPPDGSKLLIRPAAGEA